MRAIPASQPPPAGSRQAASALAWMVSDRWARLSLVRLLAITDFIASKKRPSVTVRFYPGPLSFWFSALVRSPNATQNRCSRPAPMGSPPAAARAWVPAFHRAFAAEIPVVLLVITSRWASGLQPFSLPDRPGSPSRRSACLRAVFNGPAFLLGFAARLAAPRRCVARATVPRACGVPMTNRWCW